MRLQLELDLDIPQDEGSYIKEEDGKVIDHGSIDLQDGQEGSLPEDGQDELDGRIDTLPNPVNS